MVRIKKEKLLLTPDMIKPRKDFEVIGVFNPGAVRLGNGKIILYVRVAEILTKKENDEYYFAPRCSGEKRCDVVLDKFKKENSQNEDDKALVFKDGTKRLFFISHFRKVILDESGFNIESIDEVPSFEGLSWDGEFGVEDPRITKVGDDYLMTYVGLSKYGNISTALAVSKDCFNWERKGIIFSAQNKDCVIFPEKIGRRYYAFNRPEGNFEFSPPHIWISSSKDLSLWGKPTPIKLSKEKDWDYSRIGAGPPPIKTKEGWLLIYHSVFIKKNYKGFFRKFFGVAQEKDVYSVGAALFDLKKPWELIAKSPKPIITPRKKYEKFGYVDNVIFPTGAVLDLDKKSLLVFSGAGDRCVSVRKILIKDIMGKLKLVQS